MADVDDEFEPNILLSEVKLTEKFVASFVVALEESKSVLVVVRQDSVTTYSYPLQGALMPLQHQKLTSRIANACTYRDSSDSRNYILLATNTGDLLALDQNLEHIDSYSFQKQDFGYQPLLKVEPSLHHVYVSVGRCRIAALDIRRGNKSRGFFDPSNGITYIYKGERTVVSIDLCWDLDAVSGDKMVISILTKDRFTKEFFFETIQLPGKVASYNSIEAWRTTESPQKIDIPVYWSTSPIISVPNLGTFLITAQDTWFFKSPNLQQFVLNGRETVRSVEVGACSVKDSDLKVVSNVRYFWKSGTLTLVGCTNHGNVFELTCKVSYTQDTKTCKRGFLSCQHHSIERLESFPPCTIEAFTHLADSTYLLVSKLKGLLVVNLNINQLVTEIPYRNETVLHSELVGLGRTDFTRLITCGGSSSSTGFVEVRRKTCNLAENFNIKKVAYMESSELQHIWPSSAGIYWKTSQNQLFRNGAIVSTDADVVYVTRNGNVLTSKHKIICISPINMTGNQEYVYLEENGHIHWSNADAEFPLPGYERSLTDHCLISSTQLADGKNVTVVIVNGNVTVIKMYTTIMSVFNVRDLDTVSDTLVKEVDGATFLIFCYVSGNVAVVGVENEPKFGFKMGSHKLSLSDISGTDKSLVYCRESTVLLSLSLESGYSVHELPLSFSCKEIVSNGDKAFITLNSDNEIHAFEIIHSGQWKADDLLQRIESKKHLHTKFTSFEHTSRYIVTSSLNTKFNSVREKQEYSVELQIQDLIKVSTVATYDISENYPQAIVSDMTAVPVRRKLLSGQFIDNETSYAKQLTLEKCLLVALNYESAEDDTGDNLLLFTIDEANGTIDLQLSVNTNHVITSLSNYFNRVVFVSGECLQAYQLDYSVKEDEFKLSLVSNSVVIDGFTKGCIELDSTYDYREFGALQGKKRKIRQVVERIAILNIAKGIQEFNLAIHVRKRSSNEIVSSTLDRIEIVPRAVSDFDQSLKSCQDLGFVTSVTSKTVCCESESSQELFLHDGSYCIRNNQRTVSTRQTFVTAVDYLNCISIFCKRGGNNLEMSFFNNFSITDQIVSITPAASRSFDSGNASIDATGRPSCASHIPLFLVNTCNGGCYLISTICDHSIIRKFKAGLLSSSPDVKGLEDEGYENELLFFDSRQMSDKLTEGLKY